MNAIALPIVVGLAGLLASASEGAPAAPVAPTAEEDGEPSWEANVSALAFFMPEGPDFVMVLAPVEIGRVHVEARYNYEALNSGTGFVGFNLRWGREIKLRLTPMIGAVVGDLDGWVPALRWTLAWWKLDVYSESEIVFDLAVPGDSFFYNWSELGISPLRWLRAGLAIQRNRIFMTSFDIQRGLFVSATIKVVTVYLYEFNAPWTTPTWVAGVGASF